jgi:hypothetical protein
MSFPSSRALRYGALAALLASPALAQNQGLQSTNALGGADRYLDVPASPSLYPQTGITVEAWASYDDATIPTGVFRWPTLLRFEPAPQLEVYFLRVDASNNNTKSLRFKVRTTTGQFSASYPFAAGALNALTHIAGTFDGATVRLYLDGVQVASAPASGTLVSATGPLRIGNGDLSIAAGEMWNGEIDELRIWPFARTAAEIASSRPLEIAGLPSGCSTWNLNGNGSDSSGSNHATLVNAPVFAPNALNLTSIPATGIAAVGSSSAGCTGLASALGVAALPRVNTPAFAFAATRVRTGSSGVALIAPSALPAPFPILGIDLWVDFTSPAYFTLPVGVPDALGTARTAAPIPNDPRLALAPVAAQMIFVNASCTNAIYATQALSLVILP